MALAYNSRRLTRDIDAVFEPKGIIYEEARRMADDIPGLPPDWLNDGVEGLVPSESSTHLATETFATPGISVGVASDEYMRDRSSSSKNWSASIWRRPAAPPSNTTELTSRQIIIDK